MGEVVTTIPTIGFNVETVTYRNINWTIWDVGGCDKIRPLWRHYYQNTQALIFVVDSNDRERINEYKEELYRMLNEDELRDTILLVFANKQDLPKAMSAAEVTEKLGLHELRERKWYIQASCGTSGDGLYEGFDWLTNTLTNSNKTGSGSFNFSIFNRNKEKTLGPNLKIPTEEELLERIKLENENDIPKLNQEFLQDFENGKIHRFDHRSHLRVGFIILYSNMKKGIKTSKSVEIFTQTLRNFFAKSDPNQIRQTFHITMTIFWCHSINLALTAFISSENYDENLSEEILFVKFLESFPLLMWSGLWTKYYSKDVLMTSKAKSQYVLPDLSPFPAYMSLQTSTNTKNQLQNDENLTNDQLSDENFLFYYNNNKFSCFNELDLLRICFLKLKNQGNERRAKIVNDLMEALQKLFMRLRANGGTNLIFSQTHIYFWIQIINAGIASLKFVDDEISLEDMNFHSFCVLFPELMPNNSPYYIYYSKEKFESMEARRSFIPPDKKPLPNFFTKRNIDSTFIQENIQRVPFSKLKNISIEVKKLFSEKDNQVDSWVNDLNGFNMTEQLLLDSIENGILDKITHIDMIRMMYLHIIQGWERGDRGTVAVTRIVDHFELYWKKRENIISSSDCFPNLNEVESEEQIRSNVFGNRFNSCYSGITHLHFWIQIISACIIKATYYQQSALLNFGDFISFFPELLYDRLWNCYYSHQNCFSPESIAMVVPADINALPAFIRTPKSDKTSTNASINEKPPEKQ